MSDFDLDTFLPYQLALLAGRTSRGFAAIYKDRFGLSIPDWRVLAHLSREDALSVRDIHERTDMEKSKVTRAVQRLEASGLLTKSQSEEDRRLLVLSLTGQGKALMAELAPLARAFETDLAARLPKAEAAQFRATILKLLEAE